MVRDAHFIYDYSRRRVPLPIVSYLAVADAAGPLPPGESPARKALEILRDLIEPAVIAEEELNSRHMEQLIRDAFQKINESLGPHPDAQPPSPGSQVSLTMAISDSSKAYIGHVGSTRVYLLHGDRLYDLVPSGVEQAPPAPAPAVEEMQPLFPAAQDTLPGPVGLTEHLQQVSAEETGTQPVAVPAPAPGQPQAGGFLGEAPTANVGYNEVEIERGDVIVLCTDGLWRAVSEEEMVENLLSVGSVQRSSNQLVRLAFSRDAADNATMVAWKYGGEDEPLAAAGRGRARRESRGRFSEALLVALLVVVLVGIFAVGFAFGWRITDTFRRPAKMSAQKQKQADAAEEARKQEQEKAKESAPAAQSAPSNFPRSATVTGQGVRMRAAPDPNGNLIGLLRDGEQVTVLGESMGADSKVWSRVKAVVKSGGQDVEAEGYVRNDFLVAQ